MSQENVEIIEQLYERVIAAGKLEDQDASTPPATSTDIQGSWTRHASWSDRFPIWGFTRKRSVPQVTKLRP